ncbi:MAG: hypothetical protein HOP08_00525 [Cyclobacteriaceae bacterium]|nr:hypothetical protein [Cyclobacteriaceae bacterium]
MKLFAVINGDIIGSTKLTEVSRRNYIKSIKKLSSQLLKQQKILGIKGQFEIYRGDSFQGVTSKPEKALRILLLLRSYSRMISISDTRSRPTTLPFARDITDIRVSVGIGEINKLGTNLMESDGDAFHKSGRLIDSMKKSGLNLAIDTPWPEINEEFAVSWGLLDSIVSKWSSHQAEVVYYSLQGNSQVDIASKVKASPPAINQRLKSASWHTIEKMLNYIEKTLQDQVKSTK